MGEDMLEKLKAIDSALLREVVRQDQNDSSIEISDWTVKRLSDKGIANSDGLWLFSGRGIGNAGIRPWSVVLKMLNRQQEEPSLHDLWHWKREFLLAQSGLTKSLIEPVKAPHYYHMEETSEGAWIWMEYIENPDLEKWTLDEYAFAAYQLGRWNSTFLTGASLPNQDWLTRQHYRSWLNAVHSEEAWQFSLTQKYIPRAMRTRLTALWEEREKFFEVLEGLPQVFSHFDCQRRNLILRQGKNHVHELVLLDWAQCGLGAIGTELNWLIAMSAALLEWPPADISKLDKVAFQSYAHGLQDMGWHGDVNIVRLGYVTMLAAFFGCACPSVPAWWCAAENQSFALQQFNLAGEELYVEWLPIFDYALDCADEAQTLMKKLGFE
jgi:hypothetical protein